MLHKQRPPVRPDLRVVRVPDCGGVVWIDWFPSRGGWTILDGDKQTALYQFPSRGACWSAANVLCRLIQNPAVGRPLEFNAVQFEAVLSAMLGTGWRKGD